MFSEATNGITSLLDDEQQQKQKQKYSSREMDPVFNNDNVDKYIKRGFENILIRPYKISKLKEIIESALKFSIEIA